MLHFVTGNPGKVREVQSMLEADVQQFEFDYTEIQSHDLREIAAHGAREAYSEVGEPVIVEDSGLFVEALDGFPGPYSAYVEDTVGIERLWRLVEPEDDHSAAFRSVVAYCDGTEAGVGEEVTFFEGMVPGVIVPPRGEGGFGYDPIFEHGEKTFAEMDPEEKNAVSHRVRALSRLAEWYERK
ncbi:MAG: XTP/dITP diphosphatase [Halapricum sp.]